MSATLLRNIDALAVLANTRLVRSRIMGAPLSWYSCTHQRYGISTARSTSNSNEVNSNDKMYRLNLNVPTPTDMSEIGALLSYNAQPGDAILLDGDLGAGKTCFCRGFISTRCGEERVTSPTYLLCNEYAADGVTIYHMDLYRLDRGKMPLDLENIYQNGIALIEWPERLDVKPEERLDVTLTIQADESEDVEVASRVMRIESFGERWRERLMFLEEEGCFEDLIIDDD